MKKIIFIISFLLAIQYTNITYAVNTNETFKEQEETLGISAFLKESEDYTKNVFDGIDLKAMYKDAISGNIQPNGIIKGILKITGDEVINTIKTLGYILVIIVVHSIIKSISEGLGNNEIGEITYYVQYILIVTLIMSNFSEIIVLIKDTVNNLVGFLNSLLPILLALMMSTGNIASASVTQPILLFLITFIGNAISSVLLPLVLIGTTLGIISKVSDKIQINKLSKFFKSSVVWALGIILTIFTRSIILGRKSYK